MLLYTIPAVFIGFLSSVSAAKLESQKPLQEYEHASSSGLNVTINWDVPIITSKTTNTLQVVVNPLLLRNSSIHSTAQASLSTIAADYIRFVPWFPYPLLSVPEIEAPLILPPNTCITSWNFTYADQLMEDFYASTPNVSHMINFSTTPGWMWLIPSWQQYEYPRDINAIDFGYNKGTDLRDETLQEVADYYERLVSWYVKGGFVDECGVYQHSGHSYTIEYWEILNEIEAEHSMSPAFYNRVYDAIVEAVHKVSPDTKFVGLALGDNSKDMNYFETFLNPANHKPGIPIDFVSYHFYGMPSVSTSEGEAAQAFAQTDQFIVDVGRIEEIRKRLAPTTRSTLNEIGTFDPQGATIIYPGYEVPPEYFVWSGGVFAYVFARVVTMGIDVVGESQLVGYPGQFPSVSLVDYWSGELNARGRVLHLLQQNFGAGDVVVETIFKGQDLGASVHAQGFLTKDGERKVLLINKLNETAEVKIKGFESGKAEVVDLSTGGKMWKTLEVGGSSFNLTGWATAVLTEA
ncbi:glycoside hydrolase superfamily [Rhexocercosporidium sp. MPI-PUGE-AT-0058]|nr:glycoside hydrolase superfamily [Rhexocercosporidium sp. MPI-PUGE-AT-0058]